MSTLAPPVIVPADDRHLDDLMRVMRASFDPAWGEGWTRLQLASALAMEGSFARRALGAGDAPLGFSLCRRILDEAELLLVAVAPEARGRGLGRALLLQARKDSRNLGCSRMFLEVRENNQPARRLYHEAGFFDVGRRPDYYSGEGGRRFGAVTMQYNIVD
ncbi:MAG: ribosomal protein S18-alanine N-acetyltransferase [Polymorphobacter sp.]|uniref:ribosomal protein S18-alanine N-acetyltransferase n=1 Tax=Polymorphobacter sp. TaxID=1909290 RepID=UPI003A84C95C